MPYVYIHKHYRTTNPNAVSLFLLFMNLTFYPKKRTVNMPCRHRLGVHVQLCSYLTLGSDTDAR